ncbi:MAG: DUF5615 family PIN-like protein [Candidatus Omnitrophota bacterium]
MNILADENIEKAMVNWLRKEGCDVLWAAEQFASFSDRQLLDHAASASRILLTRDLDFGELAYREKRAAFGIILLRLPAKNQWERLNLLRPWWPEIQSNAQGNFLVVAKDRLRIRPL